MRRFISVRTLLTLLLTAALLSTGCVYLRLLQTKKQLHSFGRYFELREQNGLSLVFKKPVLLEKDIIWLTKSTPTFTTENEEGKQWTYVYEKQFNSLELSEKEKREFDIYLVMVFRDGKLNEFKLPERFLKVVSKELLIKMLESMGSADVSKLSRRASSEFRGKDEAEIPTLEHILFVLGAPFSTTQGKKESTLYYKYRIGGKTKNREIDKPDFELRFKISGENNRLLNSEGVIRGLKMSIDFSKAGDADQK